MTYYDRIQNSIDFIENNLTAEIEIKQIAKEALMSIATLYRMFFAMSGFTVKQYTRQRRVSEAVIKIKESENTILDIAVEYGFSSHSAFAKTTKKLTGYTPAQFRGNNVDYQFGRINVMEKYIDVKEFIDNEKYPGVKVLKDLEPVKVAYYKYFGEKPEYNALKVMNNWFKHSTLSIEKNKVRLFGFDNPSPSFEGQKEYGYEVWLTIDKDFEFEDSLVKTKIFDGGKYAVCGVKELDIETGGENIPKTWKKLRAWTKNSSFTFGKHQWLEEHHLLDENLLNVSGMDLYMPIKRK